MSRKKPTALKLVEGNPGRRPMSAREPMPRAAGRSSPPGHLVREAKTEWRRLARTMEDLGVITIADRAAFAAYCQAYGRWCRAERALEVMAERDPATFGILIKTSNGNAIQSPLVGAANTAMSIMLRAAAECGLTPVARTRIEADPLPAGLKSTAPTMRTDEDTRDKAGPSRFFSA